MAKKEVIIEPVKDCIVRDYFTENRNKALRGKEDGLTLEQMKTVKKFAEWLEKKGCLRKEKKKI